MTTTIILDETITDTAGLLPTDLTDRQALAAQLGSGGWWFQSDPSFIVDAGSGAISRVNDVNGGAVYADQTTGANRPIQTADQFGSSPNLFPGLVFNGTSHQMNLSAAPDLSGTFSLISVAKPSSLGATRALFTKAAGTGNQTTLYQNSGSNIAWNHRNGNIALGALTVNTPYAVLVTATATTIKGRVNGGSTTSAAASASVSTGSATIASLLGGNFFAGAMSDLVLIQGVDLLDGSTNSTALLAQWQAYVSYLYSVTL